jgi:hypothetical protein
MSPSSPPPPPPPPSSSAAAALPPADTVVRAATTPTAAARGSRAANKQTTCWCWWRWSRCRGWVGSSAPLPARQARCCRGWEGPWRAGAPIRAHHRCRPGHACWPGPCPCAAGRWSCRCCYCGWQRHRWALAPGCRSPFSGAAPAGQRSRARAPGPPAGDRPCLCRWAPSPGGCGASWILRTVAVALLRGPQPL